LSLLGARGVEWVQIDEPILGIDLPPAWTQSFERAYHVLQRARAKLLLTTYFSPLENHINLVSRLPIAGLHVDAVRGRDELRTLIDWLPADIELSLGIVDGRNIWRTDIDAALSLLKMAGERHRGALWIAPSCSLLHVPFSLARDTAVDPELRGWLAGATEKLDEVALLKRVFLEGEPLNDEQFDAARKATAQRRQSARVHNVAVNQRIEALPATIDKRASLFALRQSAQRERFKLPPFP